MGERLRALSSIFRRTVEWELERADHVPKGFISRIFDKFMVNLKIICTKWYFKKIDKIMALCATISVYYS